MRIPECGHTTSGHREWRYERRRARYGQPERLALRIPRSAFLLLLAAACSERRNCDVERLEVTWPATIERGGLTTKERLAATLTPTNVTPEVFDSLAGTLVRGKATSPGVVWSVPAFNTSPGGIAVVHTGSLERGQVLRVAGVLDSAGWGVIPSVPRDSALVAVEAGAFVARDASGTIVVLETRPLALRLDLTASDSVGATVRVRGDAQFSFRRGRQRCAAFAETRGE